MVDVLVALHGDGSSLVVYGNYDTYELLRASREQAAKEKDRAGGGRKPPEEAPATATAKTKRKRKFPYKKAAEVEADIQAAETRAAALEAKLADGEVYRDAARLKATMAELGEVKAKLAGRLYPPEQI